MKKIFANVKNDLPAGLMLVFVAIPLCLGIALASGAPIFSGVIAGIIGGIIVGAFSGSALGVSGPAAGLAVVVFGAIHDLNGSWEAFLLAVMFAGFIQIIMGTLRLGVIAYYFPSSVIKGMLSAIGIIIILKQIPHALGYDADFEGDLDFIQPDSENTFTELINALRSLTPLAIVISSISMLILILWETKFFKKLNFTKYIQGPLVVVVVGILISMSLSIFDLGFNLDQRQLVHLPVSDSLKEFIWQFTLPDFSYINNPKVYSIAFVLAIIASIETLLSVEATDKIDPQKRVTPASKELTAQGIGNVVSGLIGGLPITQVIVRSTANITFGAKSKLSTIVHGVILLLSALFIPTLLNMIPLACLASILIVIGYKLATPKQFKEIYLDGWSQFLPFVITILAILFSDLLMGVLIGVAVSALFILRTNFQNAFKLLQEQYSGGTRYRMMLSEEVSFLNKGHILKALNKLPRGSNVLIDGRRTKNIDKDVLEVIKDFIVNASTKHINVDGVNLIGMVSHSRRGKIFTRPLTKEIQAGIIPARAVELLREGNSRFVNNLKVNRNLLQQINDTSDGQHPFAAILSCIDSRTSAELIFDQGLGDIFSIRVAGNIVNEDVLGSMEYACKVAGAKLIMVLGHTKCGAVTGACNDVQMGNITPLLSKIKPAVDFVKKISDDKQVDIEKVAEMNVHLMIDEVLKRSEIIKEMLLKEEIGIIGGLYNIETGVVDFLKQKQNTTEMGIKCYVG